MAFPCNTFWLVPGARSPVSLCHMSSTGIIGSDQLSVEGIFIIWDLCIRFIQLQSLCFIQVILIYLDDTLPFFNNFVAVVQGCGVLWANIF